MENRETRMIELPEDLARELEEIAEVKGLSIPDLISILAWKKYVQGDFRETYSRSWRFLTR